MHTLTRQGVVVLVVVIVIPTVAFLWWRNIYTLFRFFFSHLPVINHTTVTMFYNHHYPHPPNEINTYFPDCVQLKSTYSNNEFCLLRTLMSNYLSICTTRLNCLLYVFVFLGISFCQETKGFFNFENKQRKKENNWQSFRL